MTIDTVDLAKLARLARLALNEEEKDRLPKELASILHLVEALQKVDVSDVKPMSHAGDRALPLRVDKADEPCGRLCLEQSQGYEDGLIRVPKIIE